jgi:RNA-directed DNA polymerase
VSKKVFTALDDYMWKLTYKWVTYSHPNKPKSWVIPRYYGQFNPARQDRWVFGHRDSGAYLPKFAWTKIVRHYMVPGTASPDDPTLAQYWADRRRRNQPPLDNATLRLLKAQHGGCPLCGDYLLHADHEPDSPREWEQWLTGTRKAITRQSLSLAVRGSHDIRLLHTSCYRRNTGTSRDPALLHV